MRIRTSRLATALVVVLVAAGCQSTPLQSPASSGATPAPSGAVRPTDSLPALPPTSEPLIAAALAAGKITYEQSLLYRALALYDSPGLPAEFRSPIPDGEATANLLAEIDRKEATLSADLLAKLAPYRARPSDPISIFNQPAGASAGVPVAGAGIIVAADTATPLQSLPAVGGKARVWMKAASAADAADALRGHADDVARVWAAFPDIFTYPNPDLPAVPNVAINPDSAIDIYFLNLGDIDPRRASCITDPTKESCILTAGKSGFANRVAEITKNKSSGYAVIDAGRDHNVRLDSIAHELAHTAQFAYDRDESVWLMESTATWVAYKVDRKLDLPTPDQYGWLPRHFGGLDETLTREENSNGYAAWLYFLFASMDKGDGIVTSVWEAAAADGEQGAKAVDQVLPFADNFDEFAVRDWNEEPVKPLYKSVDSTFPGYGPEFRNSVSTLEGGMEDALNVDLPPLAAGYYRYDFPDTVRDITFDNTLAGDADAHVWAIKTVNDEAQPPEDWTNSAKKEFCRNIAEQDVSRIILIVSNNSMTDRLAEPEPPKMKAGTTGCSGWTGTMKATETYDLEGGHGTATSTFTGIWTIDEEGDGYCPPDSEDGCVLLRPTGTISWTWDSHHAKPKCDQVTSGTKAAGSETHNDQQVFYMRPVDKDHLQYWGKGFFQAPELKCINLILIGAGPPAFFEIHEGAAKANGPDGTGGNCFNSDWQIDSKATKIAGSCVSYKYQHSFASFEWNLTRVGQ